MKIDIRTLGKGGEVVDPRVAAWPRECAYYGLKPEHLGQTIQLTHGPAAIHGLDVNKRRYPIIVKAVDGKMFKVPADFVRHQLGVA